MKKLFSFAFVTWAFNYISAAKTFIIDFLIKQFTGTPKKCFCVVFELMHCKKMIEAQG